MKKILMLILVLVLFLFFKKYSEKKKDIIKIEDITKNIKRDHDEGDNFIDAAISDPITLNPVLFKDMGSGRIIDKIFNSLLDYNENGELSGDIAKTYNIGTTENVFYIKTPIYKDILNDEPIPEDIAKLRVSDPKYHNFYIKNKDSRFNAFSVNDLYKRILNGEVINGIGKREIGDIKNIEILGDSKFHQPSILRITLNENIKNNILNNWKKLAPEKDYIKTLLEIKLEFILRDNVRFHNGIKVGVNDVLFSYERYLKSNNKFLFSNVYSVETNKKENRITARYIGVFSNALLNFGGFYIMPEHILKNMTDSKFGRRPIGTGPFVFSKWESDNIIVLNANNTYFKGRPYINKYVFRTIPDYKVQLQLLKKEEIDYMLLSPTELNQLDEKTLKKYNIFTFFKRSYSYIGYNLSSDNEKSYIFRNKNIRYAITYAINRRKIINKVFLGKAAPCTGPFFPGSWAYNRNVTTFSYNPAKANKILDEEGWIDTDNDKIRDKIINGKTKKLSFDLMISRGAEETKLIAEFIKQQLEKIGIEVNIRIFEWSAYVNLYAKEKKFDAVIATWGLGVDPDLYQIWHSDNISETGSNLTSYKDKQVDDLIIKARSSLNIEKRKEYYHKIHEIIAEQQPCTFLWVSKRIIAVNKRFHGFKYIEPFSELWPPKRDKIWVNKNEQKY